MVELTTVGYGLIALGIILFLIEATMPGFFVAVPGTVLVILGIFALMAPDWALFSLWAPLIVVVVGVPATLGSIYFYRRIAPPSTAPVTQSADTLVGMEGFVVRAVVSESNAGKVKISRQVWSATTERGPIPEGTRIRVSRVEGVVLHVAPVLEGAPGGEGSRAA